MNAIESRLAEALNARAEQVAPTDLGPGHVPATVSPLRRRTRLVAVAAAAGVAVAAVVAVSVMSGDDESGPSPAPQPTVSDTYDATPEPVQTWAPVLMEDMLPEDPTYSLESGAVIDFDDGSSVVLEGDQLVVTDGGAEHRTTITDLDGEPYVTVNQVRFGDTGNGYLVAQSGGGESYEQTVYLPRADGTLVVAEPASDRAPFGWAYTEGFGGHMTWTSGDGAHLLTREQVGTEGNEFEVWQWTRNRDTLIANTRGPACFDLETDTVTPC